MPFSHIGADPGVALAFSDVSTTTRQTAPYQDRPCDKDGNLMPELLWELVQRCFQVAPSERPTVNVLADMLSAMKSQFRSQGLVEGAYSEVIASASGASRRWGEGRRSLSPLFLDGEDDSERMFPPSLPSSSPSPSHSSLSTTGKGKQRHFEEEYTTVRFGPVEMDGDPEDIFAPMFEGLLHVVRRDVLVQPAVVAEHDFNHLAVRFSSLVDANNFAMTWMFYRFEPYRGVSAMLVDA